MLNTVEIFNLLTKNIYYIINIIIIIIHNTKIVLSEKILGENL